MSIIDSYINKRLAKKGIVTMPSWDRGTDTFFSNGYGVDPNILELYKSAYSRINLIARNVASLDIDLYRKDTDVIVNNHALINLIENPGGATSDYTKNDFIEAIVSSTQACDQTFIIFEYADNVKYPISARVALAGSVVEDRTGKNITGFRYENRLLQPREYIRISGWSPLSDVKGLSPLTTVKDSLSTEQAIAAHELGVFNNNAIPAGAMVIEADKLTFDFIKEEWTKNFLGAGKANKLAFIRKDPSKSNAMIDYKQYTTDNRNLDLQVLFDRIDKKINEAFGVPKEMMGDIQATNLAGVKLAKSIFWENVGIPVSDKIVDKINRWIKIHFPNDKVEFKFDTPDFDDYDKAEAQANIEKTKAETAKIYIEAGFEPKSVLEHLEIEGIQTIVLPAPANSKSTKDTPLKKKTKSLIKQKNIKPEDNPDEFKQLRDVMYSHLDDQYTVVKELQDPRTLDYSAQAAILAAALYPVLKSIYNKVGGEQMGHLLGELDLADDLLQFELSNQLDVGLTGYSQRLSSSFEADTQVALKNLIDTANDLAWSASQTKTELRHYYKSQGEYIQQGGKVIKNNARYRADRLVITESVRANNQASLKSIQDISQTTGMKFEKIWRRTRTEPEPICDFYNGKVIGIFQPFAELGETVDLGDGKKFTNNYSTLYTPDPHPFCRCEIEYRQIT